MAKNVQLPIHKSYFFGNGKPNSEFKFKSKKLKIKKANNIMLLAFNLSFKNLTYFILDTLPEPTLLIVSSGSPLYLIFPEPIKLAFKFSFA